MATRTPPPQGNITPNDVEFDQIRLRRQAKFNVLASINSRIFIGNGAALYISYFHKSTFYIYMSSLLLQITPKVQSLRHSGLRTVAPFIQWWRSRPHSSAFASAVVAIFAEPALVSVWLLSTCHLARSSLQDILHRTMSN